MHYQQAVIAVSASQAEALSDSLMNHGALSTAIEDAHAGTAQEQALFGEPGMPGGQLWQKSVIIALFAAETDIDAALAAAAAEAGQNTPPYQLETVPEQDWVRLTQSQFDPIQISPRLWITPSWHPQPTEAGVVNLQLDPGLAFGTGSHPTTHLCLEWLDTQLQGGEQVLDYGCGSGILTIAALKLGAGDACGVDIDPQALRASEDNARQNQVAARFYLPETLPPGQFDVVVANILANPLRALGDLLAGRTRPGGRIVLSGILEEQQQELCDLYRQWFNIAEVRHKEGWICISGVRLP